MGSWFSQAGAAGGAATTAQTAVEAGNAADGLDWDKLLGGAGKVQGLMGASAGAVPQFGPPGMSGTPQPGMLDIASLIMQKR